MTEQCLQTTQTGNPSKTLAGRTQRDRSRLDGGLREREHDDKFGAISVMGYQYHSMLYNKWKEKRWHLNNGEHSLIKLNNYS